MRTSLTARTARTVVVVGCLALGLAGCSDTGPASPMPTQSSTTATTSSSSTTTGTASPTGSASPTGTATVPAGFSLDGVTSPAFPKLGGDLGAIGLVRVGRHSGYDRVVWQFSGPGRPSFKVHYVDQPVGDPSGEPVPVKGQAYVEVLVTFVGMPPDGTPIPKDAPASSLAGTVIAQADAIYGGFEGYAQTFIGVRDTQRPLRVTTLTNPTRLVVDVYSG